MKQKMVILLRSMAVVVIGLFVIFVYVPVLENVYTGIIFYDGTRALLDARDGILKHVEFEWQKLPIKFNSKYPNGLIIFQTNWLGRESESFKRYKVINPCTTKVDWWGWGKVKINFTQIDSTFGCKIISFSTDSLQRIYSLEEKPIWVWEPNPKGWKNGKLVFKD